MKKVKYVALILVLALGLIGGAYAYWTDTVTVAGAVETGTLEHKWEIEDDEGYGPTEKQYNRVSRRGDRKKFNEDKSWHYVEVDVSEDNASELEIGLFNMYPGAEVWLKPKIKNVGTLPSKVKDVTITRTGGNNALYESLQFDHNVGWGLTSEGSFRSIAANPPGWTSIDRFGEDISEKFKNYQDTTVYKGLCPGEYILFGGSQFLSFRVDPEVGNKIQDKDVSFKITFEWEQVVGLEE